MSSDSTRAVLEVAYARLREKLEAKDVSVESLRSAALEALAKAKAQTELDPAWVATELDRLRNTPAKPDEPNGD